MESHLLQMRGLKRRKSCRRPFARRVASFTDAWIETGEKACAASTANVASFTDAWIETLWCVQVTEEGQSHLLQMRGLKLMTLWMITHVHWSHLLQMRGLKQIGGKDVSLRA